MAPVSKHLKNIGVVSLLTVCSRVLGLMRDQLGAAVFGASVLNSAFLTAFRLPNLFRRLLGEGSLTAAFLPTLQEELHVNGRPGAFALLNKVVTWLTVVTGTLVALAMFLFSHSRALPGHEFKWYLAADLAVLLFPYLLFVCLAAIFSATLNVFERFLEPALSPIWLNLAMIITLGGAGLHWADTKMGEIHWLCAGVLIGGFLQMGVPAVTLMAEGWRPRIDFTVSPRVREIAALMAPGFLGTAIYQVNIYVSSLLAYKIDDSAASWMFYANRLMELPIGVFAIAVSTVVYPLISRHVAAGHFSAMADDFRKGLRLILIINLPAAAGLALLGPPIVRLLFQHGAFTASDAEAMAGLLQLFVVGMPFFSVVNLTVRAFFALKDTRTPVRIAMVDFIVNLGLSLALMHWLGARGLVMASTTAIVVQALLLKRSLTRRRPEITFAPLLPTVTKVLLATLVMGLVVSAGWWWLIHRSGFAETVLALVQVQDKLQVELLSPQHPPGADVLVKFQVYVVDLAGVLGLIPLAVISYALLLWALKIEGREEFAELAAKFRGKISRATASS